VTGCLLRLRGAAFVLALAASLVCRLAAAAPVAEISLPWQDSLVRADVPGKDIGGPHKKGGNEADYMQKTAAKVKGE